MPAAPLRPAPRRDTGHSIHDRAQSPQDDAGSGHHHPQPASGPALTGVAVSATLHCLAGCALGEIAGMAIGTALGLSTGATVVLAIALAFGFGYSLTSLPLLRAGLALSAVVPIALASDTVSIAVMEIVDNAVVLVIPGAMDTGLGSLLFWGSLSFALAVAFAAAVPVNRWLIAHGRGHAAVHRTGIHGGPNRKAVAAVVAVAFGFGAAVLIGELVGDGDAGSRRGADQAPPARVRDTVISGAETIVWSTTQ